MRLVVGSVWNFFTCLLIQVKLILKNKRSVGQRGACATGRIRIENPNPKLGFENSIRIITPSGPRSPLLYFL